MKDAAKDRTPEDDWYELHVLNQSIGNPETVLEESARIVDGDREETYGHPALNFERTAVLWSVILGHPVTVRQVALMMVGLKLAREVHQPKRDNLVDACGYLRCIEKASDHGYDVDKPLGKFIPEPF